MCEEASVGITFLVGSTAYLLDDSQIVSAGLYGKSFIVQDETLIVVNELLRHLTEGNVFGAKLLFDELCQGSSGINIGRVGSLCPVYPDTLPQIFTDHIRHSKQCYLYFEASLKQILDRFCIKIHLAFHQGVECRMNGKQQFVQFGIDLHGFIALAVQSTLTRIP